MLLCSTPNGADSALVVNGSLTLAGASGCPAASPPDTVAKLEPVPGAPVFTVAVTVSD
jgi:hypothetical protein